MRQKLVAAYSSILPGKSPPVARPLLEAAVPPELVPLPIVAPPLALPVEDVLSRRL